jgi:hypothetical protein
MYEERTSRVISCKSCLELPLKNFQRTKDSTQKTLYQSKLK